jgi:hypothetical protein
MQLYAQLDTGGCWHSPADDDIEVVATEWAVHLYGQALPWKDMVLSRTAETNVWL